MFSSADCRKYRKWKRERAAKLKKTKQKIKERKVKERTIDCVDEDEIPETAAKTVLKISYRKCKKKRKKKRPARSIRKIYKRVSLADLVLKCIKPSMEERTYLLYPRHVNCLDLRVSGLDIALETASSSQPYATDRKRDAKKWKPCGKSYDRRSRKETEDSELEDDECKSVCSFDSEICLAGVKLTTRDKEEIKKYQREAEKAATDE